LVILALLPQGILKISQKGRQHYGPSCRRAGRLPTRLKEISALSDRKVLQRRPAFEVLDENLAMLPKLSFENVSAWKSNLLHFDRLA
jgi:hypothetical protein